MAVEIGRSIGDYEVLSKLRAGGMATLYIARRAGAAGFARNVALKVVHPHLAHDQEFVAMFIDEAKVSARIQHPNVVHVETFGQHENDYFMVMEFVHGCSLSQLNFELRERDLRLSPEMAVHIMIKVLDGLHAAHEAVGSHGEPLGVVHRDVTPSNVLLSYQGPIKLIDFGVAKAQGRIQQTGVGQIKGKFGYMSPEQAEGKSVDRRTDIYAAGIILWEMITQRRYNLGETPMESLAKAKIPLGVHPREYVPSLKPALDALLMKALSSDPDDRPQTARVFRRLLAGAYPAALGIDDQDVSDFVVSVMDGHLRAELAKLPSEISGLYGQESADRIPTGDADRLLKTHTVNVEDLMSGSGIEIATDPTVAGSLHESVSGVQVGSDAETVVAAPPRRVWPWLAAMVVVGLGAWLGVRFLMPAPETVPVTAVEIDVAPSEAEESGPELANPNLVDALVNEVPNEEHMEPTSDETTVSPAAPARRGRAAPGRPAARGSMMSEGTEMMSGSLREVGGTHILSRPGF